ncbi:hypothetical protein [Streptomyces sp. 039-1]|uniref:hypothetical protein n=1 Tax=Streptomyces sp. 039-1 TaxID=2789263 RepID=UPI0039F5C3E7
MVLTLIGGLCELLGLFLAGEGIRRTRQKHARDLLGTWETFKKEAARLLSRVGRAPDVEGTSEMHLSAVEMGAFGESGSVEVKFAADATAMQRDEELLKRTAWLTDEVDRVKTASVRTAEAVDALRVTLEEEAKRLRADIDKAVAGDIRLETIGLWFAAFGVVLSTIGAFVTAQ